MTGMEKPVNRIKLAAIGLGSYFLGIAAIGLILFLLAGSFSFWNAWLLLIACAITMACELIYLVWKDPEKLAKRLQWREKRKSQKKVVWGSLILELIAFVIPGLDFRFGWSSVPTWLVIVALFVFEGGFALFYISMNTNRYASRVIELQENQKVIDTGPNAVVRHPMYACTCIVALSLPLLMDSYWMLMPMALLCAALIVRIRDEEKLLIESLDGYRAYMQKVKYRMIPYIW